MIYGIDKSSYCLRGKKMQNGKWNPETLKPWNPETLKP